MVALSLTGEKTPVLVTNILSLAYAIYLPAVPLLRPLGWTVDAYWSMPKWPAMILIAAIYGLVLFGIGKAVQYLFAHR